VSATSTAGRGVEAGVRDVRAVTDLEVSFFRENGWVLLRGLISAELSEAVLARGRPRLAGLMGGSDGRFATPEERYEHLRVAGTEEGTVTDNDKWVEWRGAVRSAHDPVLGRAGLAKTMGRNVQRLLGRDQPYGSITTFSCASSPTGSAPRRSGIRTRSASLWTATF
jgi:hypothetical protein